MLSNKPMRFRLAISGLVGLSVVGILYLELWINFWLPNSYGGAILLFTALVGGFLWSWTLPHPRQERKRREKLEELRQQSENEKLQVITEEVVAEKETLAEKRP